MKPKQKMRSSHPLESYGDPRHIAKIFYSFIGLISLGLLLGAIITITADTAGTAFAVQAMFIGLIPVLASAILVRRGNFEAAAAVLAMILMVLITALSTNSLGIHHIANLAFPVILVIASLVMRKRVMAIITLFAIGCAAWLVFGELSGAYTPSTLERSVPGDFFTTTVIILTTAVMVRLITESLFQTNRRLLEELEERKLAEERIHWLAKTDSLTNLVNRREFERRLEGVLVSANESDLTHVLCYMDLDQFKIVNDSAGHAAGDELLRQISKLLSGMFRQQDTFARLGGDEFGLLLENCQLEQAKAICDRILAEVNNFSFAWGGNRFHIGVSIGVVPITAEVENISQILSQADIACYSAKDLGRNRVYVYHRDDSETAQRHSAIKQVARMREALINDQFHLYCQPIAQLEDDQSDFSFYEILLRMVNDENNLVLPDVFIPPAERYGLMPAIDRWVIRKAFETMFRISSDKIQFAINLSGNSLDDDTLLDYVLNQLREFPISPDRICFEITETAAIRHLNEAGEFIREFQARGGKIALDDFGSGFSSFRYLKSLQVNYIKIDGAFITNMIGNPDDQAFVEAIASVAHTLGIHVIAEHASNQETIDQLRKIGVESIQGYGIGYPAPIEDVFLLE
jgi:diguanylate cyclase (GGDEF)-like protein